MSERRATGSWFGIRRSIRRKLMLMIAATTLVALLVAGAAMVAYDQRTYQANLEADLRTQAEILGRASAPALAFDDRGVATENLSLLRVRPKVLAGALYTAKGELFASYTREDARGAALPARPGAPGLRREGEELVAVMPIVDRNETIGTVYLRAQYEAAERLATFLTILAGVIVLSFLVAIWVSSWLQWSLTQPLLEITDVARQVRERRDYSLRAPKSTEDEIGYLVESFNDMLAELGRRAAELERSHGALEHEMKERRGAEAALRTADRLKDEFIATLAHELRNPLAPLRNSLEILRLAEDDKTQQRRTREVMERQLRQLVRLVDDLLDVSRITTGKLALQRERTALGAIVERALELARPLIAAREQQLAVQLPAEPVYLYADAARLAQVITNLLHNAAKFSARGGQLRLSAAREGADVLLTVSDDGIGIAPGMLGSIFRMFVQADTSLEREQAGLGVGLSLARHLVELHGGSISAASEGPGRGSRFSVRLPALEGAAAAAPQAGAAIPAPAARKRILLADDNEDFAASMAALLAILGHEVRVAGDGEQALAEAARFAPEVAFLDIGLPKLNGYDLARRLDALPRGQRPYLVAVTGWGAESDKRRAREAGFDHHMVKPVELDQVRAVLSKL